MIKGTWYDLASRPGIYVVEVELQWNEYGTTVRTMVPNNRRIVGDYMGAEVIRAAVSSLTDGRYRYQPYDERSRRSVTIGDDGLVREITLYNHKGRETICNDPKEFGKFIVGVRIVDWIPNGDDSSNEGFLSDEPSVQYVPIGPNVGNHN